MIKQDLTSEYLEACSNNDQEQALALARSVKTHVFLRGLSNCVASQHIKLAEQLIGAQNRQHQFNPLWIYGSERKERDGFVANLLLSSKISSSCFVDVGRGRFPSLLKAIRNTMKDDRKTQEGFLRFLEKKDITQEMVDVVPVFFPRLGETLSQGEFFRESCAHFAIRSHPSPRAVRFLMDFIPLKEMEFSFLRRIKTLEDVYPCLKKDQQEEILIMVQTPNFQRVLQEDHHQTSKLFWQALVERTMIAKHLNDTLSKTLCPRKKM